MIHLLRFYPVIENLEPVQPIHILAEILIH
jgi:hypothetical protein